MSPDKLQRTQDHPNNPVFNRRELLKLVGTVFAGAAAPQLILNAPSAKAQERGGDRGLETAIEKVSLFLAQSYANNRPAPTEEVEMRTTRVLRGVMERLKSAGVTLPQSRNDQTRILEFFRSKGYVLAISPMLVGPDLYVTNTPFYKLGRMAEESLTPLQIGGLPKSAIRVPVFSVSRVLVEDFRASRYFPGSPGIINGQVVSDTAGKSNVLIFEEQVKASAKLLGESPAAYRQTVVVNEIADVYFTELLKCEGKAPDAPAFDSLKLSEFGIQWPGGEWALSPHLAEAFSDWASLKAGSTFISDLKRILTSESHGYALSKHIALKAVEIAAARPSLSILKTNPGLNVLMLLGPQAHELKTIVVGYYEAKMKEAFTILQRELPKWQKAYEELKKEKK